MLSAYLLAGLGLGEVRHLRIDHARRHGIDANSTRAQRGGEMPHQCVDGSLCRRISRQRCAYHRVGGERRNEYDAAAVAQNRKRLLDEKVRRANIDGEQAVEILHGRIFEFHRLGNAGIRNQNIQTVANRAANLFRQMVRAIGGGKVCRHCFRLTAGAANLGHYRLGFLFAAARSESKRARPLRPVTGRRRARCRGKLP